jgi:cell fate regulator YaaT (PSP1 superfamily)
MSCNKCAFNINSSRPAMLDTFDWLNDLPDTSDVSDIVEVRFKSTRKEYFRNNNNLGLIRGETVVVASSPGHDLGIVTLTGHLAEKQFDRKIKNKSRYILETVYRKATPNDLENWEKSRNLEKPTMIRAREIAAELKLKMKIGDVEYRGDGGKAIFYYIADGRIDFRELIKRYAQEFKVRVEMKQIGARQEAARIGGIGSCGRELCCSGWRTDFSSVSTDAILKQGLSPSASKMAGACGKLKCCLMYEIDAYMEAGEEFPVELLNLETSKGIAKPIKTDYLSKKIWYALESNSQVNTIELTTTEVKKIIQQNKKGIKPDLMKEKTYEEVSFRADSNEGEITRFDKSAKPNRGIRSQHKNKNRNRKPPRR